MQWCRVVERANVSSKYYNRCSVIRSSKAMSSYCCLFRNSRYTVGRNFRWLLHPEDSWVGRICTIAFSPFWAWVAFK